MALTGLVSKKKSGKEKLTPAYIPAGEGWLYLAGHTDLFTGEVVGYAMSERMTKNLVSQSILNAIAAKRAEPLRV